MMTEKKNSRYENNKLTFFRKQEFVVVAVLFVFLIALALILGIPSALAVTINNCTTLGTSGYYELNESVNRTITCMTITANNVELDCKGYTITYGSAGSNTQIGIDAIDGSTAHTNLTIRNCIIYKNATNSSNGYGIRLTRFSGSNIINNTIRTNGTSSNYGIYILTNSQNNNVTNNTIETSGTLSANFGVRIDTSTGNKIYDNNITTGGTEDNYGVYLLTSANNNEVSNNNITARTTVSSSTGATDNRGIVLSASTGNNLSNNKIFTSGNSTAGSSNNNRGIDISTNSDNNIIQGNQIQTTGSNASNYGILLSASSYNNVSRNTINTNGTGSNYGIYAATSANNNWILHNIIAPGGNTSSNQGIRIDGSINAKIYNNTIGTNGTTGATSSNYGIYLLTGANFNDVANNTVNTTGSSSTNIGIAVVTSSDNNISNNIIQTNGTSNNYGLYVATTALRNNLLHNNVTTGGTSSTNYGIYILESTDNKAYNNTVGTNGTSSNRGITLSTNADNNDIANNTISTGGSSSSNVGIMVQTTSINNTVRGNVINTNGTSSNSGIYISASSNNRAENNVVNTSGSSTSNYGFYIDLNSQNNVIHNNTISTSGGSSDAFILDAVTPNFPHNNNISSNTFGVVNRYYILLNDASINGTYFIDQYIANYSFTGPGSLINFKSSDYGVVSFTLPITGTRTNLSNDIYIRENYAFVNGSVSGLNRSANITLYNRPVTLTKLTIYRDGVACPASICTNLTSMQAGNVTFSVTNWSQYSINNSDPLPPVITLDLIADGLNTSSQNITFNFTVTDETSQNLSCDLMIDNNATTTNLTIANNSIVNLIATGIAANNHSWNIRCFDEGNNTNTSLTRSFFVDIYGPTFFNISYSPNNSAGLDPLQNITFNSTITDNRVSVSSAVLQYHNGTGWRNASMSLTNNTNNSYNTSILLISNEANYTFNIWANDSLGNANQSVNQTFSALWDCDWNVSTSDLGATSGFAEIKRIGNITINNTGDVLYPNNNCSLSFSFTYSLESGRIFIEGSYLKPSSSYTVSANSNRTFKVDASFLSEIKSESAVITTNEVTSGSGISETKTRNTSAIIVSTQGGPYLFQKITASAPSSLSLTPGNFSFEAYIRNLLGDDTVNNTAYNVTFNWTLPNSNFLFIGNATRSFINLSNSSLIYNNINLSFNETNLPSLEPKTYYIYLYAQGRNFSGGLIVHANNQTLPTEQFNMTFSCNETSDSIAVSACGTLDPDNPKASTGGGGGGGAGGGAAKEKENPLTKLVQESQNLELVRGEQSAFILFIENPFNEAILTSLNVTLEGFLSEYLEINPSFIPKISEREKVNITILIKAPTYFTEGIYNITLIVKGRSVRNASYSSFEIRKYLSIAFFEISREDALEDINLSEQILEEMNASGFYNKDVEKLLKEMKDAFAQNKFAVIQENYKDIQTLQANAQDVSNVLQEMRERVEEAERRGIGTPETLKLTRLAEAAFFRGDFEIAASRLKEARLSYALEVKGEFNLFYAIKENPGESAGILLFTGTTFFTSYFLVRWRKLRKKLKLLDEEEKLLIGLMKVVQRECFEKGKMSMGEYEATIVQYENRLYKIIQEKIVVETKLAHILRMRRGKEKALKGEVERLRALIKETQKLYFEKGKLETRIYENMLKSYAARLSDVEEQLALIDAQKEIRKWRLKLPVK